MQNIGRAANPTRWSFLLVAAAIAAIFGAAILSQPSAAAQEKPLIDKGRIIGGDTTALVADTTGDRRDVRKIFETRGRRMADRLAQLGAGR